MIYYVSLDFYKLAGYNAIWFSRPEKYEKLARLIEKIKINLLPITLINMDWIAEGITANISYEKLKSYIEIYNGTEVLTN